MSDSSLFQFVVLPLLIFFARIMDVSLGTLRIIFVSRQKKLLSAATGFFEVLIWLLAITQVLTNLTSWIHFFAYATGFATGNYVGIWIDERLAMGMCVLRIITKRKATMLLEALREADIGYTVVDAEGATGPVHIIFIVLKRRNIEDVLKMVGQFNPNAFYTIEDVRGARNGVFPLRSKSKTAILQPDARKEK